MDRVEHEVRTVGTSSVKTAWSSEFARQQGLMKRGLQTKMGWASNEIGAIIASLRDHGGVGLREMGGRRFHCARGFDKLSVVSAEPLDGLGDVSDPSRQLTILPTGSAMAPGLALCFIDLDPLCWTRLGETLRVGADWRLCEPESGLCLRQRGTPLLRAPEQLRATS